MSSPRAGTFDQMVHTANAWVADVAEVFGTNDRRFAYRLLRAWLHTLRDRLTVDDAVQFAAQLPELIRGVYYDGWNPSSAPVKYGPEEYVDRFAREASIPAADVPWTAARIALITQAHFPPGQLEHARAQMPDWLSDIVAGADEPMQVDGDRNVTQADDRLEELAAA